MGVVSGREEPKLGLDGSSTTALILENVRVPAGNVLGKIGEGHRVAFNVLNLGRLKLGTRNIGSAKQALSRAAVYAAERRQFGRPIAEFGMIKQKLGEMAVRCYVGDAIVYRTLGDVDRALAAVPAEDSERVLKVIESFAVECSINKVWTSEALAFVVDEALQTYGGYGYSKEYPAERAYRDARITRIYEGTNEINRLIIPTRLLKNETTRRLFDGDHARRALEEDDAQAARPSSSPLAAERNLLARARRLVPLTLGLAKEAYGERLAEEQEVLGHVADVTAEVYALESALLRTEKIVASKGETAAAVPLDVARVYASDAAGRMEHSARQAVAALADGGDAREMFEGVRRLTRHTPPNTVAARRRIADASVTDRRARATRTTHSPNSGGDRRACSASTSSRRASSSARLTRARSSASSRRPRRSPRPTPTPASPSPRSRSTAAGTSSTFITSTTGWRRFCARTTRSFGASMRRWSSR
jgi:alkylation response protein AidB-like acyl-CoA dehydrogenase